jgi:hypothetical protein
MSAAREQTLNTVIAELRIGQGFEEWLATVDRFYAEHVQVSSDATPGRLIGRARVKLALLKMVAPLHLFADADIRSVSLRCMPIYADRHNEHHSAWSLEIVDASGRRATVRWCVRRIWRRGLVVHEHFYENDMNGETLAVDDLWIPAPATPAACA